MTSGPAPETTGRMRRLAASPYARDLVVIAGVTFVLRVAWVLVYGRVAPGPNDTILYQITASNLASGNGYSQLFGEPTANWPPGFPFLISIAYRVFGLHLKLALVVNVALATATVVLLYFVALRMFGRTGARVAATLFALVPGSIYFTGLYVSETAFIFCLVSLLALAMYLPDRRWTPVVLGVALGLSALTRGEGVLMLAIPLALWWGLPRGEWLRRGAVLLAAMALTVAPWTIRNAVRMDAFIPVALNASVTLWSAHNPTANGGPTYAPTSLLRRADDEPNREVAETRLLRREAIRWALRNPHKELGLIPRKLLSLNGGVSRTFLVWTNARGDTQLGPSSLIVFTVLGDGSGYFLVFAALAAVFLIGLRRLSAIDPGMRAVLVYLAVCLVTYGFFYFGQHRYRVPMEPFMILVATPLLTGLWALRGRFRPSGTGID